MKYILYTVVTKTPDGMHVACSAVPSCLSAYLQLQLIGAHILGINFTKEQAELRACQHGLAIDAYNYSSN